LIKYPALVFIILLIGYCQLFTYLYKNYSSYSSISKVQGAKHYEASGIKGVEIEGIYIEEREKEDDEQSSLKEYSHENLYFAFFNAYVAARFVQNMGNYSLFCKHFSCFLFSQSSYLIFCVFRL